MAFMVCRTCGEQVADTAPECPKCGTPTGVEPPERPRRWGKYALVFAGVVVAAGIVALIGRQVLNRPAEQPVQPVAKAPPPEPAPPAAKAPPQEVAKAPPQERAVERGTPKKHGVYFLAGYASGLEGRELLREIRPVVAPDESAMNEVVKGGTGALAFRPLGLACGPEREPYYAWVYSTPTAQSSFGAGAACGYPSLAAAAQRAMEGCRENRGCQRTDAEIQLYAGDVRDGAGEEGRGKPRLWCQFTAGSIVNAWQYGPQKTDFNSGCASLLFQ
jgi:zinc ribbon protein